MDNDKHNLPEQSGFTITQEFLDTAFSKKVNTFKVSGGSKPGDNYLSILYGVEIVFQGDDTEKHYLIKCYPNNPGRKDYLDQHNIFAKELFMYADFFPQIEQLVQESGSDAKTLVPSLAPYHAGNVAAYDITTNFKDTPYANENFIMMTDLRKPSGFKMVDRLKGLDLAHAKLAIIEIAKFHALTWAYKQKHGLRLLTEKFHWFLDTTGTGDLDEWKPMMESCFQSTIQVVQEFLGADHPACKNMKTFLTTDKLQIFNECLGPEGIDERQQEKYLRIKPEDDTDTIKDPWLVGAHGDCWVNNMLFRYEDDKPVEVALVDFQIVHEACPTTDLGYFMFTSVRAPIRIKHEDELVAHYFGAFVNCCEQLGVEPLPGFTLENVKRRYRRGKIFGILAAISVLCLILKPEEESKDMDKQQGDNLMEMMSAEMEGSGENVLFREEMTATILNLYEDGII